MAEEGDIEEEEIEGEEGEEEAPKSKKKLFIIAGAAAFVLLLAIGGGAYFFLFSESEPSEEELLLAEVEPKFFYEIPTMTVNLNTGSDEKAEFLKLSVSLELANESMLQVVEPRMALVRDAFQVYLRELRRTDLEGSAGIYRLKEELRRRVNLAIYPAQVDNILFNEILVQ